MSVFETLNNINVNDKTEQKNGLTYLSWAWAWGEVKKIYPEANYIIYENADSWNYFTDGKTCWVKTGVIIEGIEHIEYLPVMDYKNKSIPADSVTSFDVNKAIQRSLTKALARHGLGLYIYAGEDLPEEEKKELSEKIENKYLETIKALIKKYATKQNGKEEELIKHYSLKYKVKGLEELTNEQGIELMKQLSAILERRKVNESK